MTDLTPAMSPADGRIRRYGEDPLLDAWLLHFMTENHLEHSIDPENATPEQLRFMVALPPDRIYIPCTDEMFARLSGDAADPVVLAEYAVQLDRVNELLDAFVPDPYTRTKIRTLCELKYRQALVNPTIIPSRLGKRLCTIFLTQSGLDDPYRERKQRLNRRAADRVKDTSLVDMLYAAPRAAQRGGIPEMRYGLDCLELARLLVLGTVPGIWEREDWRPNAARLEHDVAAMPEGFARLTALLDPRRGGALKILFLPDASGGLLFDLLAIRALLRLGHRVILAFKAGFYFDAPTIWDSDNDPVLEDALGGAYLLDEPRVAKNALLQAIRENPLTIISDGTRERLNLYRVSVTFARAWKEADLILAKGALNHLRLIATSQQFTRDIAAFHRDEQGVFRLDFKPRAAGARSFTEAEITAKAEEIVSGMRAAKAAGKAVMFYSAIIGSIPGQTQTAIALVTAFVASLREKMAGTYIINPAEHFEEGMDADDLMFMWEKVQRSGLLDVWRFQTHFDIEKSFALLGQPMPPAWAGKDATFSTGCTKEMHIALSMQARQPELQIIGPDPQKFFRRREYGVGRFFDSAINGR